MNKPFATEQLRWGHNGVATPTKPQSPLVGVPSGTNQRTNQSTTNVNSPTIPNYQRGGICSR
jgi:hypothetical protein